MATAKLIAANWKMCGRVQPAIRFAAALAACAIPPQLHCVICPPFPYLAPMAAVLKGSAIALGGQNCAAYEDGAFTGEVSAAMLGDIGCAYVILGHSERRQHQGETDALVAEKTRLAHAAGLKVILCVGEADAAMPESARYAFLHQQTQQSLSPTATAENTVIAYEPVWAIGSGKTPGLPAIAASHQHIAASAGGLAVLYGGSVKPDNAAAILALPEVAGALVGGASLQLESFLSIINAI